MTERRDIHSAELEGDVLLLTLGRPERRNALSVDTVSELADRIEDAGTARTIILTGEGSTFCSGGDLASLSTLAEQGSLSVADGIYGSFHRLVKTLAGAPPVVGAINGPALGAGLDLALCCDLRVAGRSATFASSWIGMGLVPGMGGAWGLGAAIGSTRAAEMLLLGRRVDVDTALSWGLVNEVTDDAELSDRAVAVARRLAELPAAALLRTKQSLRRSLATGFDDELTILGATQGTLLTHTDFRERAEQFLSSAAGNRTEERTVVEQS